MPRELKAHRILREIEDLKKKLIDHQAKCKHLKAVKKLYKSQGFYDPYSIQGRYKHTCPTCLKIWIADEIGDSD